jgi:hypothetical protein
LPISNSSSCYGIEAYAYSTYFQCLSSSQSKYFQILDRANIERVLHEQALGMSGAVDERTAVKAGNLIGANTIVICNIVDCVKDSRYTNTHSVMAYIISSNTYTEQRQETRYNSYTYEKETVPYEVEITRYSGTPVETKVYSGIAFASIKIYYQIISVETGQVLANDFIESSFEDEVEFADCGGCQTTALSARIPNDIETRSNSIDPYRGIFSKAITDIGSAFYSPVDRSLYSARRELLPVSSLMQSVNEDAGKRLCVAVYKTFFR